VPPFEFTRITQLPWFLCLGVLAGAMGAAFLKLLNASENAFKNLRGPIYLRLGLGGMIVGIIALLFPGVWGNGYVVTNRILHGEYGSPLLSADDIASPESLALRLKQPAESDMLSRHITAQLSPATKNILSNYNGTASSEFQKTIADDLNRIMANGALFETQRFAGVTLSAETVSLLAQKPEGGDLVRLNRKLLLEAYPQEISTDHGHPQLVRGLVVLFGLFVAKLIATLATVGSGAVGGVFTPTLFLGAGLGGSFALLLRLLGAGQGLPIAPFALVGMGSMLSATTRSPLLAMIMIFEISLDYSLMPALMLACVVSILVARKFHPESIYTEPLRLRGLTVSQETTEPGTATERTVGDLMRSPVPPVRESATLGEIAERFLTSANNFLPVVDAKNQLVGLVALQDLKEYLGAGEELRAVIAYDVMRPPPACVTPNQRLLDVLPVVLESEQRNIPVVNTLKENRLVGALARTEVLSLFSEAIAAKSKAEA
jgi:CBS domain-containing protein